MLISRDRTKSPQLSCGDILHAIASTIFLTPTAIPALMGLLQDFQPRRSIKKQKRNPESRELVAEKSKS